MIDIKSICLDAQSNIIEAMKVIEKSDAKIALIVNDKQQLLGSITDGDVRRGLINSIPVSDPVTAIMNKNPIKFLVGTDKEKVLKTIENKKILQIPLVDQDNRLVDIVLSAELLESSNKKNSIILMAGGLGTRLGHLTAECPKPMLKVGDKPILEIVLENLKSHGFSDFSIAVNFKAEMIENYFEDGSKFGARITYLREKERMGTAGALSLFEPKNNLPLIVMNGDVLTKVNFTEFLENHKKNSYQCSMCVRKYDLQVPFGVVQVENQVITNIEEKPTQSFFVSAGIYSLNPELLQLIPKSSYFDMPSLFNKIISDKKNKAGVFPIHEYWMDVGRRDDFNQAQVDFKKVF